MINFYTRETDIQHLYSECILDPLILAEMDAPMLAVDKEGNALPYIIECTPRPINKIETKILIFADEASKQTYERNKL